MHPDIRILIAVAIAVFALPRIAAGQEHQHRDAADCPAGQQCPLQPDADGMQARHAAMMQQHEQAAARIQELQERMHAANGEAKVEAIEALLDEMLAQHRAMHAMMMGMHHSPGMGEAMKHDGMKHDAMAPQEDAD